MIKPGSLVIFKRYSGDYFFGIDSNRKMVAINKNDQMLFLEKNPNTSKLLTSFGIIVTIMAEASDFEVLENTK